MQGTRNQPAENAVSFGKFRLYPAARLLECDGAPVRIGGRALDILILLAKHARKVVSKRELIARVWSHVTVDGGSLRFHVTALRKALGDGKSGERHVTNVPGRGYSLVVSVLWSMERGASDGHAPVVGYPRTLPARSAGLVGRASTVQEITKALTTHRFVTIVGPGGIGKTSVAIAAAHTLSPAFGGQVSFVDLGPLTESRLVPSVVASTLGLMIGSGDGTDSLVAALQDARLLLILDSCEHVIESVAVLAELLVNAAPSVHILATSPESLRAEGERIYRLFPLQCPPEGEDLSASDLLGFSATQLFVERATAGSYGFVVADAEARFVSEICHRLDGIPHTLEIVAARIDAFGLRELAARLDDRLLLTVRGRRTAVPRHRTLQATPDWSYELLGEDERILLRHLAIFTGPFTLEAVTAVTASLEFASDVIELLLGLVAKSLVALRGERRSARYRLLDTTRAYALAKLVECGERNNLARRHAKYYSDLLERAHREWESHPGTELLSDNSSQIDNVRAALDWAFSPECDAMLGVALTTEAIPTLIHSSLLHECRSRAEQAIAILSVDPRPDPRVEMKLRAALGASLLTIGDAVPQIEAPWARTLHLAKGHGAGFPIRSVAALAEVQVPQHQRDR
jgi:predicted ATPase/DNA-binding winged helix-turn-helix (wHTH) protein